MSHNILYRYINEHNSVFTKRRDCYVELKKFIETPSNSKICALYGLRRTGKTVLMDQMIEELTSKNLPCMLVVCKPGGTMSELENILDDALKNGVKYVFVDEITYLSDFQACASSLANFYAAQGLKIVITGTDSLGIALSRGSQLLDRIDMIHTSYISFGEFHRLLGKNLEEYISYGGTLTDSPYKDNQKTNEYFNSAIVENILSSLERNEGIHSYPPELTELYERGEIGTCINKLVNKLTQSFVIKALLKEYESAPLGMTLNNMKDENRKRIDVPVNRENVNDGLRQRLKIKSNSEIKTKLTQYHLDKLKEYLENLGLLLSIDTYSSFKAPNGPIQIEPLDIVLQPGMVYVHGSELVKELANDSSWRNLANRELINEFIYRADRTVKGAILENAVIANTYLNYNQDRNLYISKLVLSPNGNRHEADMVVVDSSKDEVYLFEVKYSAGLETDHIKHLISEEFIDAIEKEFGAVAGRYVIYNGVTGVWNGIKFVNAEDFFDTIYNHKDVFKSAIVAIDDLCVRGGVLERPLDNSLDATVSSCKTISDISDKKHPVVKRQDFNLDDDDKR